MSYLKLIWDFKGPNSEHIAKHHEIHLKEFFDLEKKQLIKSGIEVSKVRSGRKANTLVCSIESKASPVPTLLIQHF